MLVVHAHAIDMVERLNIKAVQINWGYLENFGAIGVDIFFVISGFIMAYISKNLSGKKDAFSFLQKRMIRIYPLYLIVTIFLIVHNVPPLQTLLKDITLIPIFDNSHQFTPLTIGVAWSLSFELFFYLLVFVLLFFNISKHVNKLLLLLLLLASTGSFFTFTESHVHFIFNAIFFEFAFGILICNLLFQNAHWLYKIAPALILISFAWFIALICFGYKNISEVTITVFGDKGFLRVLLWGIPAALLVAGCVFLEKNKPISLFKNKILQAIGNASYSIYLTHIISFPILLKINFLHIKNLNGDLLILVFMLFAVIIGIVIYTLIEKPLLLLLNKQLKNRKHLLKRVKG